jgi:diaminopimelate decarboxylase
MRPSINQRNVSSKLRPKAEPDVLEIAQDQQVISDALEEYGSPVHIHLAGKIKKNAATLQAVFDSLQVKGFVLYAQKANRSSHYAQEIASAGYGIDVASEHEFAIARQVSSSAQRMLVSAATKSDRLLAASIEYGNFVSIDNLTELELLRSCAAQQSRVVNSLIRVSGFSFEESGRESRFGFQLLELSELLHVVQTEEYSKIKVRGFHFHLDGYSTERRSRAILELLPFVEEARQLGHAIDILDIGGGITVQYLSHGEDWSSFSQMLAKDEDGPDSFWRNRDGLGQTKVDRSWQGEPKLYPFYSEVTQDVFLRKILEYKASGDKQICELLRAYSLEVWIEPGRALLDQCGCTISRVSHIQQRRSGETFVVLEMNQTQIRAACVELCIDPIWVMQSSQQSTSTFPAFLVGNTCMESDFILRRRIVVPEQLQRGDACVFLNTAGYHMHLFEHAGHQGELPKNIIWDGQKFRKDIFKVERE